MKEFSPQLLTSCILSGYRVGSFTQAVHGNICVEPLIYQVRLLTYCICINYCLSYCRTTSVTSVMSFFLLRNLCRLCQLEIFEKRWMTFLKFYSNFGLTVRLMSAALLVAGKILFSAVT